MFKWIANMFASSQATYAEACAAKKADKVVSKISKVQHPCALSKGFQRQKDIPKKEPLPRGPDCCYLDPAKCYRCGKPSIDGCCEIVHLYKNVKVGAEYPKVVYEQKTLKMPLCKDCSEVKVAHGWGYFIYLQEMGLNGWKQGESPSKSEIDAVWRAHLHPRKDIWGEALKRQEEKKERQRIADAHTLDVPIAVVDQYEVLKELGAGGFGSVFLARDTISATLVAIKGLPKEINSHEDERESLRKNFSLIAKLHHPNIASALVLHPAVKVRYIDAKVESSLQIHAGDFFMVMEFARGDTLMKWRQKNPHADLREVAEIVSKVAGALDFAHDQGILHRDIKPSNIMVRYTEDWQLEVKILDFGLAAELNLSMNRLACRPRGVSGTLPYMSPEQWRGEKQGVGTDIYALAVVAYEMLEGTVPYASAFQTGSAEVMFAAVANAEVQFSEKIWPEMEAVLRRGLEKKSRNRYFSCSEFAKAYFDAVAILEKRKKEHFSGHVECDWRQSGELKDHPLNAEISGVAMKRNSCGPEGSYLLVGLGRNENYFWEKLEQVILKIPAERLLHSNEVLSLDFSHDMDDEERFVMEVSESCKQTFGDRNFETVWKQVIDWAKLFAKVLVKYKPADPGVRECIEYRRRKRLEFENNRKAGNIKLKGITLLGNPFYQERMDPEKVLCDYYAIKCGLVNGASS